MFSWLQAFVAPFVIAHGGSFWHDTIALVIPPTEIPIDISYVPDPKFKSLIIGLTFGTPREYDPSTGTIGPELVSTDVGIYHAQASYMDWHWDPFVESILRTNPYPQLLWSSHERPYQLRIVNYTSNYVWVEATFWVIKFPRKVHCPIYGECDPEDLFKKYMSGITKLFVAINEVEATSLAKSFIAMAQAGGLTVRIAEKREAKK